jgi:prepilin-type N-terminal cleavage/methylation domain-containing protein
MPLLSVTGRQTQSGFTLAELLISLAILGVIATFTIPKILTSQQNAQYNALSKETIAMVAAAYQQAQLAGTVTTATKLQDLTSYMNYVALDTASTIDGFPGGVTPTCSNTSKCLKLHNGALLYLDGNSFADNGGQVVFAVIDPDGRSTGVQDSQGMLLYYTGRVITYVDLPGGSIFAPSWYTNW